MVCCPPRIVSLPSTWNVRRTCALPIGVLICPLADPPIVLVDTELVQSEQHQNVTIECHAFSRPFARIFWEKNGQMIEENKMSHTRVNQTMSTSRLTTQVDTHTRTFARLAVIQMSNDAHLHR